MAMASELTPIDPALRISSVALAVSDVPRSADFYERVLGLPLLASDQNGARLGGADSERPLLELVGIADPTLAPPGRTGLFHVAWLHPSRAELAATVQRVLRAGWTIGGASDHGVSEALYLSDPDGLGIEIYADRPRAQWERPAGGHGVNMITLPLDVEDLLAQSPEREIGAMEPDVSVGHVHLKVSDVPRAASFYRDALGFEEQARLPSAAFLSAGGYHHHLGLNSWQSEGQGPASETSPGLRRVEFELGDEAALAALERRLSDRDNGPGATRERDGQLSLLDPDGQLIGFHHR
jgi:catechol 2,3-dioxygenase